MQGIRAVRQTLTALAATTLLTACGQTTQAQPPNTPEPPSSPPAETSSTTAQTGPADKPAPKAAAELQFTAKTLDGKAFDGKSLAGKPALLWFWAPWCPKCNAEAPGIAKAAETHGDSVRFVGVAAQDELPAMQAFANKHGVDAFTNLNDATAAVWTKFDVTYQPAYAFISADGQVEVVKDQLSAGELERKLAALAG